jgi:nicotinate-nucleotide adenylyltransferase
VSHPPADPRRIGLLGGTFDPPHLGHLAAAEAVRDALGLDQVLLVVANRPWQKVPVRAITPAEDRFALVAAAAEGIARVKASRLEIDRGGPSYTIETVEELRADARADGRPEPELFVVVGGDLVESLPTWHRVDDLRQLVTLVIVARPGSPAPHAPTGWRSEVVDGRAVDVSSSGVRDLLARGEPVGGLLPERVVRCIARRGLYAVPR